MACFEQGKSATCLLTTAGSVQCFGSNSYGQTGIGSTASPVNAPGTVVLSGVAALSAGYYHFCALMVSSGVRCWGTNVYGQLGIGTTTMVTAPPTSDTIVGVMQLSLGTHHTCALMEATGGLRCFGYNWVSEIVPNRAMI